MARTDAPRLSRSARAPWIPAVGPDEVRAHVQTRLRLMAGLIFWVCLVLFGFVLALYELYPDERPRGADLVHRVAFVGLAALGAIWGIAMRRPLAIQVLYRIDALIVLGIGGVFGLSAYVNRDERAAVWAAFIWHTFTVFSRALIVPSTGRRTAVTSVVSYLPFLAAGVGMALEHPQHPKLLEVPPVPFVIGVVLFSGMATLLATTGSRVIYGLRADLRQARQLGQYTLTGLIAKGPMSAVYHARHALLRRPTAVKLLPPEKHGPDDLARFEREVQHMSQLTHPNTVAIYDYGRSPDGVFYYAMEYVDGVDLEVLVHLDGPLPAARAVPILRQICGALDEAHSRGLTHRDVKPANVILCRRGNQPDVVKVLDFGLVVEVDRGGSDGNEAPAVLGTPAYLAPEVITSPGDVGPRSDLYGVGAVAYFLLTGERVFTGTSVAQLCLAHVHEQPVPPTQRTDRPISPALEALVLACLAKDPAARPQSARTLRAALDDVPEAADWDEDAALAWWTSFEERRKPAASGGAAGPRTITVDLMARATTSGEVS